MKDDYRGRTVGVGVWEPGKSISVSTEQLQKLVSQVGEIDLAQLTSTCDDEFMDSNAWMMKLGESAWQVADALPAEDLVRLVRFFTLAEMQLPGWEGGKRNPVICLVKILKSRDEFPADLRKWIRANTDNRYLPYGAAL